jgi:hypothetical protein
VYTYVYTVNFRFLILKPFFTFTNREALPVKILVHQTRAGIYTERENKCPDRQVLFRRNLLQLVSPVFSIIRHRSLFRFGKKLNFDVSSSYKSGGKMGGGGLHGSGGSSRRKPVAPQWFNPSWHDDSDDEEVINGVCVFQNALNFSANKDTVRVEPTSPSEAAKNPYPGSHEGSVAEDKSDDEAEGPENKSVKEERKDEEDEVVGRVEDADKVSKGAHAKLFNHSEVKCEPEAIEAASDTELGD